MNFCNKCKAEAPVESNFCPLCGSNLKKQKQAVVLTGARLTSVALVSLLIFAFGWYTQIALAGKPPTKSFKEEAAVGTGLDDPSIKNLKANAEKNPSDIDGWRALAAALTTKLRESEQPSSQLVFETLGVIRKILDINPKDADALIAMSDISFDQQAFSKAIEFYQRYLEVEPGDLNARSRYGSALSFTGQFDKALAEFDTILKEHPTHFHAKAYSAITYAQMGKNDQAKKAGQEALQFAPSEEARGRFSEFLAKLDEAHPASTENKNVKNNDGQLPEQAAIIADNIRSNTVAGPKFVKAEMAKEDTLTLHFSDFPMDKMPPFVRDKFLNGIKTSAASAKEQKIKDIKLVDSVTGAELASISLTK